MEEEGAGSAEAAGSGPYLGIVTRPEAGILANDPERLACGGIVVFFAGETGTLEAAIALEKVADGAAGLPASGLCGGAAAAACGGTPAEAAEPPVIVPTVAGFAADPAATAPLAKCNVIVVCTSTGAPLTR